MSYENTKIIIPTPLSHFEGLAVKACKKNGYVLMDIRRISDNPADWYLFIVLASKNNSDESVTWLYNADTDSLNQGHYYEHYRDAKIDYDKRG
jgi:hypothetical protein